MKNRLEIARELLRDDGVIFVQCDDNEQAYLKVLMDEIFGRENFVCNIVWRKIEENASSGGTMKITKTIRKDHEYILCYEKIAKTFTTKKYLELPNFQGNYKNLDNDPRGDFKAGSISMKGDKNSSKYYEVITPSGKAYSRVWRVTKEEFKSLDEDNRIYYGKNGDLVPQIKIFLNEERPVTPKSIFENLGSAFSAADDLSFLFDNNGEQIFATPKPEALIKRIIEISTQENDLVLDFFAGSGTTLAVAHKMKRRYIGIEQMEYIESITKERLKKVIKGEQGGISKAVSWSGGGNLIYCELASLNAKFIEKIENSSDENELNQIYESLQKVAFIDYRVDIQNDLKDDEFSNLDFTNKKRILKKCLDRNMDYIPYADIDDSEYKIDERAKKLNKIFYGENDG